MSEEWLFSSLFWVHCCKIIMAIAPAGTKNGNSRNTIWRRKWKWRTKGSLTISLLLSLCSFFFLLEDDVLVHLWLNTTITYLTIQIIININPSKYCVWLPITLFSFLFLFFFIRPISFILVCKKMTKCKRSSQSQQKDIIIPDTRERKAKRLTEMNIKFMKFRFNVVNKTKDDGYKFYVNATIFISKNFRCVSMCTAARMISYVVWMCAF